MIGKLIKDCLVSSLLFSSLFSFLRVCDSAQWEMVEPWGRMDLAQWDPGGTAPDLKMRWFLSHKSNYNRTPAELLQAVPTRGRCWSRAQSVNETVSVVRSFIFSRLFILIRIKQPSPPLGMVLRVWGVAGRLERMQKSEQIRTRNKTCQTVLFFCSKIDDVE